MPEPAFDEMVAHVRRWWTPQVPQAERAANFYHETRENFGQAFLDGLLKDSVHSAAVWDAVNLIAQDLLLRGEVLPPSLAAWVAARLKDNAPRPNATKDKGKHLIRNMFIQGALAELVTRYELKPTRNAATDSQSACDVVAKAFGLGYKSIEALVPSYLTMPNE